MRVGFGMTLVNRCLQGGGLDGIGNYTVELLCSFRERADVELFPYSFGLAPGDWPSLGINYPREQLQLPRYDVLAASSVLTHGLFPLTGELSKHVDLVHATDHLIPRVRNIPVVATLMDAIPLTHPEWVSKSLVGRFKTQLWKKTATWADRIITISDHSKRQIVDYFDLAAETIDVIPLGVDKRWFAPIVIEERTRVRKKHDLRDQNFICVGTLQPRKNIEKAINAYLRLPRAIQEDVGLVVVGRAGWQCDEIVSRLGQGAYGAGVRWLKHLPDNELRAVLQDSIALVFPSLHEGFGLPVLEAFASRTPVIASNTTSLPEVAGDAALLIDPHDEEAIADAMRRVVEDDDLASWLKARGYERAALFTWDRTAEMTVQSYRRVFGNPHL